MFIRKIGKLLRGKATPVQIMLAAVLGSMLGFVPGFAQGAGAVIALTLLLVILNANLFVAAISGAAAKAASFALMPVSFAVGRVLLDGPIQGLFAWAINAPVLAWFGLEHYATTGGLAVGLVFGLVAGWLVTSGLERFRKTMKGLEEGSPRYTAVMRAWWARVAMFVFVGGGHGKKSYDELMAKRIGNVIRPAGVLLAVLVVVVIGVGYQFTRGPILTAMIQRGLEQANGATVDLESADVDLPGGKVAITGLAMADPNALDTNVLEAARVEADLSTGDLLRKRLAFDRIELVDGRTGFPRRTRGRLIGPAPGPAPAPPDAIPPDSRPLEEYIREARVWRDRLAQARRWLQRITPQGDAGEQVAERVHDVGYTRVKALHLVRGAPTVAVYELLAGGVETTFLEDETLSIRGENLSTQPWLLENPARVSVESSGGTIRASAGGGDLALHYGGLAADAVGQALAFGGDPPFAGGTIDLDADGTWSADSLVLPMRATLRDSTLTVGGSGPTKIDRLVVPIGVGGTLDDPRVVIDDDALAQALVDAGAGAIASRVKEEADRALGDAIKDLPPEAGDAIKGLGDLLGGSKKKEGGQ